MLRELFGDLARRLGGVGAAVRGAVSDLLRLLIQALEGLRGLGDEVAGFIQSLIDYLDRLISFILNGGDAPASPSPKAATSPPAAAVVGDRAAAVGQVAVAALAGGL